MRFLAVLPGLALAACAPGVPAAQAATLAVKYRVDDQQTYRLHEVFTGALAGDSGEVQAVTFDLRAVEATRVTALDPDGTATLLVQLIDLSGISNGQTLPPLGTQTYQVRMGPDGRVVGGGGGAAGGSTTSVPSADQDFAILPDHPVKPGDSWTRDFERANPFGSGSLKLHSENQLLRYEQPGGVRAAVVHSRLRTPLDLDLKLASSGVLAHETGSVSAEVTSWLDPAAGRFVKTSSQTRFDLTGKMPYGTSTYTYTLTGSQTVDLERTT